jgi:ligand-binding SRPBCC domain-containing protein
LNSSHHVLTHKSKSVRIVSETEEQGSVIRHKEIVETIPIIAGFSKDITYTAKSIITKPKQMESFVEMPVLSLHHVYQFQQQDQNIFVTDRNEITLPYIFSEFTRVNADASHKEILQKMKKDLEQ